MDKKANTCWQLQIKNTTPGGHEKRQSLEFAFNDVGYHFGLGGVRGLAANADYEPPTKIEQAVVIRRGDAEE